MSFCLQRYYMLEPHGPRLTAMKGLGEWGEWTFNGGVKDTPLYFVFSPVMGGEFIFPWMKPWMTTAEWRCLVFICIICPDSSHGTSFAFAWGGMYTAEKVIEAEWAKWLAERKQSFQHERAKLPFSQHHRALLVFYIKTYISSLICVSQSAWISVYSRSSTVPPKVREDQFSLK